MKPLPSVQDAGTISDLKKNDKMPTFLGNVTDYQQNSSCSFEIRGGVNNSANLVTYERTLKEKERYLDTTLMQRRKMMRDDEIVKEVNTWQNNHSIHLRGDSAWTGSQASVGGSQTLSWNDGKGELLDGGCAILRLRRMCVKKLAMKDMSPGTMGLLKENDDRLPDGAPNLELALGADMEPSKQGILPFLMGKPILKDGQDDQPAEKVTTKEEEEDVSACLSLSLSFPFPDKQGAAERISKVEQLLPDDRRRVNTSLLLFKGLSDE
ncbi:hypothetical protein Acr_03g0007390 [Actinidia rufa]|uniref:Uncharacterized protein n=1 Tax=Actinidia rufa TaxID=165716 RepID=A0A7J0EC18_9ERIC|nr:hypothetical protein Acr_03g0007390 [Actinidia rufa]